MRRRKQDRPSDMEATGPQPSHERAWPWPRRALVAATLFFLASGAATLGFWYYAATSGWLQPSENELYLLRGAGLVGLIIGALGLFFALASFRRAAWPAAELLEAIDRASSGDRNIELAESGPRELRALARAFNQMLSRERAREQNQLRLEAEVAHRLQAELGTLQSQPAGALRARQIPRLQRMVEDWRLLTLAANGELRVDRAPTNVSALADEVLTGLHNQASLRGVSLRASVPNPPPIDRVDRKHVAAILERLVLSALDRAGAGCEIDADVVELRGPRCLQLSVSDNGRPFSPEELGRAFTTLSEPNPYSTGLELVVAEQLAQAQGGRVLASSGEGTGTTITVELPLA